jgi:hypothetical protein
MGVESQRLITSVNTPLTARDSARAGRRANWLESRVADAGTSAAHGYCIGHLGH